MMTAASLVAFALVFLGATTGLSALMAAAVLASGGALRRRGPWVERRAAAGALVLPPLLALGLVAALAADSALGVWAGTDHCLDHDHHLHLCLLHGAAWASQAWALALVVFAGTFAAVRSGLSLWAHAVAQRSANRLRSLGTELAIRGCFVVPSRERFAFTAGLVSPTVLLSSAAWESLSPDQRDAVLAHELGHLAHGDLWRRAALGFAASFGAPLLASRVLGVWSLAAERICDRRAALAVGRPSTVASAMLALVRTSSQRTAPAGAV
ncbi:MAG: M48 family metalloprotease, partial [Deltaproteobacteria bacterium]|nr:M48 family metalloprotease [Deltaproteobacteria bacterium]